MVGFPLVGVEAGVAGVGVASAVAGTAGTTTGATLVTEPDPGAAGSSWLALVKILGGSKAPYHKGWQLCQAGSTFVSSAGMDRRGFTYGAQPAL